MNLASIRQGMQALINPVIATTEGRVVFILQYSICASAIYAIYAWNTTAAAILVLGFIVIAQVAIASFFESPTEEGPKRFIVEFCAIGYGLLLALSLKLWNDAISHEVLSGITVFALKVVTMYFKPRGTIAPV